MGVAAFILACILGLVGPALVHVLAFGSLKQAERFFRHGDLLAVHVLLVYVVVLVAIAIAGSLYARGKRVAPLVLHALAAAPFAWAVGGAVVRDRVRLWKLDTGGYGRMNVLDFVRSVASTEVVLDIAATMSAFAMMLVALSAIVRHAQRRDAAGTILVAGISSGVLAASALHAASREVAFQALYDGAFDDAFASVGHATSIAHAMRIVSIAFALLVVAGGVVMSRRIRGPHGRAAFAFLVVLLIAMVIPPAIASRDDTMFHAANPSAVPDGVRIVESPFSWDPGPSNHEPRIVVKRDGETFVDVRDGTRAPIDDSVLAHDPLGLIADRDVTISALRRAQLDEGKTPVWLTLYVAPASQPDVSSLGTLARFVVSINTTTKVRLGGPSAWDSTNYVFITLGEPMLRIYHESGPEIVTPSTNDPPAVVARRAALDGIRELVDYPIYIRVRETDTLARIWLIVDDIRAVARRPLNIHLTDHDRPAWESVFKDQVW